MLRVLELFAGIGAFSKALTNLGIEHEIVDAVEIDKYAIKGFNAIHGTNFEPQDICEWNKDIECDIIMHGSPCQDFSGTTNTLTSVQKDNYLATPYRIRKLTPRECWRLMGFDDDDFNKAAQVNSNTQLYKQAGNSIVVNCLEEIIKGIEWREDGE